MNTILKSGNRTRQILLFASGLLLLMIVLWHMESRLLDYSNNTPSQYANVNIVATLCGAIQDGRPVNRRDTFERAIPVYIHIYWNNLPTGEMLSAVEWLDPSGQSAHATVVRLNADPFGRAISYYWFKPPESARPGSWKARILLNGAKVDIQNFHIE